MIDIQSLNEEQRLPVLDTEGAVLVLAGAGSGKTRVLTARISHLVSDLGVSPENILAITFTNKAAAEMRERLDVMTDVSRMWVCTIHSMCVKILRMFAERRGLPLSLPAFVARMAARADLACTLPRAARGHRSCAVCVARAVRAVRVRSLRCPCAGVRRLTREKGRYPAHFGLTKAAESCISSPHTKPTI